MTPKMDKCQFWLDLFIVAISGQNLQPSFSEIFNISPLETCDP